MKPSHEVDIAFLWWIYHSLWILVVYMPQWHHTGTMNHHRRYLSVSSHWYWRTVALFVQASNKFEGSDLRSKLYQHYSVILLSHTLFRLIQTPAKTNNIQGSFGVTFSNIMLYIEVEIFAQLDATFLCRIYHCLGILVAYKQQMHAMLKVRCC